MIAPRLLVAAALLLGIATSSFAQDARPAAPAAVAKPTATRTIYLIRHGLYDRDDKVDDRVGNPLNALGREQAKLVGERLAALPVKMNRLVSSTLTRARETADLMNASLAMTVEHDSLLSECTPRSMTRPDVMSGKPAEEILDCDRQLEAAWKKYVVPAGAEDRHDVLVCHGNVIRWFVARAIGAPTDQWAFMDAANGSVTAILVRPDGTTRLVMFNDVGHLPLAKQTWSGKGPGWAGTAPAARPAAGK